MTQASPVGSSMNLLRLAALALALVATPVGASNLGFLGRGPISRYTDADIDQLRGALGRALAAREMNVPVRWSNPQSKARGEITPLREFERDGAPCRELQVANYHPQASSSGVYTLCRRNARWVLAAPQR